MRKTLTIISSTLLLLLVVSSCSFNNIEEDIAPPTTSNSCDSISATFSSDVFPIITLTCSGDTLGLCHQAASPRGDFTTYAGVKAKVDGGQFVDRVFNVKDMPASFSTGQKALSVSELNLIQCWLDAGALDN